MNSFLGRRLFPFRSIVSISGRNEFTVRHRQPGSDGPLSSTDTKPTAMRPTLLRHQRQTATPEVATNGEETINREAVRRKTSPLEAVANASSISGLVVRLLKMRVIKNMTKNGKYARFSSLVAVGNGRGAVGVSHSKAIAAADAVSKATKQATRLMEHFPRWQDRTLFHDDIVKFQATILIVRPAAPGAGRRCHPAISEICRCMGIKDISAKVHGSRHSMNVAEAFLMALRRQKTPEMVAQESGMRIIDVLKVYQEGCEELSRTLRSERYSTLDLKRQWNNQ
ncbi:hypothetical protein PSACC_03013 [Paramicrosporidium saccamoebae]|uniref:S5 DRBM domain-containing protein n=1 Tax=Paramicrosporidium saccamoebae TaxID=1246581 RepID=A0A2H9THI0_9FUNG|nr:hypothetical protein PSACC_03013 [Paramicrosporidium saccamoebae]